MANNAGNVAVGKPKAAGGVLLGPLGTALPSDAVTALNVALIGPGYVSSDGVVVSIDGDVTDIFAWGNDKVASIAGSQSVSAEFTLIESLTLNAAKAAFGDANVTETAANATHGKQLAIKINATVMPHKVWVFDMQYGVKTARAVFADGQATRPDSIEFIDDDLVKYHLVVNFYPDASGNAGYLYWDDGVTTA